MKVTVGNLKIKETMKEIKADIADTIKRNEYAGTVTSNE
jgi:hypothetical protein